MGEQCAFEPTRCKVHLLRFTGGAGGRVGAGFLTGGNCYHPPEAYLGLFFPQTPIKVPTVPFPTLAHRTLCLHKNEIKSTKRHPHLQLYSLGNKPPALRTQASETQEEATRDPVQSPSPHGHAFVAKAGAT